MFPYFLPLLFLLAGSPQEATSTLVPAAADVAATPNFNVVMMEATFKISGRSAIDPSRGVVGTMFVMGKPQPDNPSRAWYVGVTAAHVLEGIAGDEADVVMRGKEGDHYRKLVGHLQIRDSGRPIWVKHPDVDIAVMYLRLPRSTSLNLVATDLLASDEIFQKYELNVGDEVLTVGYPGGAEANELGFPILRSGRIASHPLVPARERKAFLVDLEVFGGNSGGPVYIDYVNRTYQNRVHIGERIRCVIGVMTQQMTLKSGERLSVAGVVPAQFVKETIDLLAPRK